MSVNITSDLENYKVGARVRRTVLSYRYNSPRSVHLFDKALSGPAIATTTSTSSTSTPLGKFHKCTTPNKSYKCSICDQLFSRNHDLKRHQGIHTDFKPFNCYCGKSFGRKDALKRHILVKGCQQNHN
jgi:uncharacterized Zn-finger protein